MTCIAPAPVIQSIDPAIALADSLQSAFAAQCGGHQRTRATTRPPLER